MPKPVGKAEGPRIHGESEKASIGRRGQGIALRRASEAEKGKERETQTPDESNNLTVTGAQQGSSRTLNLTLVVQGTVATPLGARAGGFRF